MLELNGMSNEMASHLIECLNLQFGNHIISYCLLQKFTAKLLLSAGGEIIRRNRGIVSVQNNGSLARLLYNRWSDGDDEKQKHISVSNSAHDIWVECS